MSDYNNKVVKRNYNCHSLSRTGDARRWCRKIQIDMGLAENNNNKINVLHSPPCRRVTISVNACAHLHAVSSSSHCPYIEFFRTKDANKLIIKCIRRSRLICFRISLSVFFSSPCVFRRWTLDASQPSAA